MATQTTNKLEQLNRLYPAYDWNLSHLPIKKIYVLTIHHGRKSIELTFLVEPSSNDLVRAATVLVTKMEEV